MPRTGVDVVAMTMEVSADLAVVTGDDVAVHSRGLKLKVAFYLWKQAAHDLVADIFPTAPSAGVACYRPAGTPVTITSAAVSPVTTNRNQPGPAWYEFVVAFPAADVPALTADMHRAYDAGDAIGMSVAGQLWQAPQLRRKFIALRAEQINLLSRNQAFQLYHLLVPSS